MIEDAHGNLLQAEADALVNTVNCVGAMGKGIALQFKQAYPEMAKVYERACARGEVVPGRVQVWPTGQLSGPKYIINFPTKREWFRKSSYTDIQSGLVSLVAEVQGLGLESVAVPPLGCGNGGLSWDRVRPMIVQAFASLPEVRVLLFAPSGAPAAASRVINTKRPSMNRSRALFIAAIDRYSVLAYEITLLEIQKLAYFLQEAGEPLRLKYEKAQYGPYSDNLNKVLEILEGHFIAGFDGERNPKKSIALAADATAEAKVFLAGQADAQTRLDRVGRLIEGFETPYGMELLSSVHFVAVRDSDRAIDAADAVRKVHAWNPRKKATMSADHIRLAWTHLLSEGWMAASEGASAVK